MQRDQLIEYYRRKLLEDPYRDDPALQLDFLDSNIRMRVRQITSCFRELRALRKVKAELVEKPVETVE